MRIICGAIAASMMVSCDTAGGAVTPTQARDATVSDHGASPPSVTTLPREEMLSHLAIPFQENDGQWDTSVAFKSDVFAGSLWVTREGQIVYSLLGPRVEQPASSNPADSASPLRATPTPLVSALPQAHPNVRDARPTQRARGWTLVESFVDGHAQTVRGVGRTITNVSYFLGNDERRWAPGSAATRCAPFAPRMALSPASAPVESVD